jgi:hypothetical protein
MNGNFCVRIGILPLAKIVMDGLVDYSLGVSIGQQVINFKMQNLFAIDLLVNLVVNYNSRLPNHRFNWAAFITLLPLV